MHASSRGGPIVVRDRSHTNGGRSRESCTGDERPTVLFPGGGLTLAVL